MANIRKFTKLHKLFCECLEEGVVAVYDEYIVLQPDVFMQLFPNIERVTKLKHKTMTELQSTFGNVIFKTFIE